MPTIADILKPFMIIGIDRVSHSTAYKIYRECCIIQRKQNILTDHKSVTRDILEQAIINIFEIIPTEEMEFLGMTEEFLHKYRGKLAIKKLGIV